MNISNEKAIEECVQILKDLKTLILSSNNTSKLILESAKVNEASMSVYKDIVEAHDSLFVNTTREVLTFTTDLFFELKPNEYNVFTLYNIKEIIEETLSEILDFNINLVTPSDVSDDYFLEALRSNKKIENRELNKLFSKHKDIVSNNLYLLTSYSLLTEREKNHALGLFSTSVKKQRNWDTLFICFILEKYFISLFKWQISVDMCYNMYNVNSAEQELSKRLSIELDIKD